MNVDPISVIGPDPLRKTRRFRNGHILVNNFVRKKGQGISGFRIPGKFEVSGGSWQMGIDGLASRGEWRIDGAPPLTSFRNFQRQSIGVGETCLEVLASHGRR
jgi:hypothetical protein